ncbi:MAG: PhnD/SsuA/transferrin family substrate-binding protein, partial [Dehalococcoidia bacterium]|nr:PhnD/SsuA/transferrin family substrate-binding protein [Dehalococcoidia bacterium]
VFVARTDLDIEGLEGLQGKTFTFGSESSTSGHLMPRYFLIQAGIDPEKDFQNAPGFSGSHDKTWKLVESGTFQAGALGESIWESAVEGNRVDLSEVQAIYTTPAYYNYNWTIRGDVDETFGDGFTGRVQAALLAMDSEQREILDMFQTDRFIESGNQNYRNIDDVARNLDIIR